MRRNGKRRNRRWRGSSATSWRSSINNYVVEDSESSASLPAGVGREAVEPPSAPDHAVVFAAGPVAGGGEGGRAAWGDFIGAGVARLAALRRTAALRVAFAAGRGFDLRAAGFAAATACFAGFARTFSSRRRIFASCFSSLRCFFSSFLRSRCCFLVPPVDLSAMAF